MSDTIRRPSIKLNSWGGEQRIAQEVTFSIACSTYPNIQLIHHKNQEAAQSATNLTAKELFSSLGKQQAAAFAGIMEANSELTIDTGGTSNNTLTFKGITLGDTYSFTARSVSISGSALPEYAVMEVLDYSIYGDVSNSLHDEVLTANSILEIIKKVEENLFKSWKKVKETLLAGSPNSAVVQAVNNMESIHNRNSTVRKYFLQILENSKETFGWDNINNIVKNEKQARDNLTTSIYNKVAAVLKGSIGSFLSTLSALASQFQAVYIPGVNDPGKLVNMMHLILDEPEKFKPEAILSANMQTNASTGFMPLGTVTVKTNPDVSLHSGANISITVPESNVSKGGKTMSIQAPVWFPSSMNSYLTNENDFKTMQTDPIQKKMSALVDYAVNACKLVFTKDKKTSESRCSVAKAWGLCYYAWSVLAGCVANITIPGTFGLTLGKRYTILSERGEELFTGFLHRQETSISTTSGCLTFLQFSHIMTPEFTLPGYDEVKEAGIV